MRILIELPSWLGDTVMTTPAIENLLGFYKKSEVTLIGSLASIELFKKHPKVKRILIIEKRYLYLYQSIKSLGNFDLFISFRGSFRSKFIKFIVSTRRKYHYDFTKYNNCHQVEKYNHFINSITNNYSSPGKLIIHKENYKTKDNNDKKILGINPGASYGSAKRWYPKEFADVATHLSDKYNIIIFGGPNEVDIAYEIENYLIQRNIKNYKNLSGQTSISDLIREISSLNFLITGDSGPMHIAAAFKIPTISIFGPTKSLETSQWQNDTSVIIKKNLQCQPCMRRVCPLKHHNCMKKIKAKNVLDAFQEMDYGLNS